MAKTKEFYILRVMELEKCYRDMENTLEVAHKQHLDDVKKLNRIGSINHMLNKENNDLLQRLTKKDISIGEYLRKKGYEPMSEEDGQLNIDSHTIKVGGSD